MPAPKGNRFWEARSSHGRKPIFSNPDQLWKACVEYFEWNEDSPLYEYKPFHSQGEVIEHKVPKMRAMTIAGLCLFLDIDDSTWAEYRKKDDFSGVCANAEKVIRKQKFEGASADLLNPAIIARDLGLADKKDHGFDQDKPMKVDVSPTEAARMIAFVLAGGIEAEE